MSVIARAPNCPGRYLFNKYLRYLDCVSVLVLARHVYLAAFQQKQQQTQPFIPKEPMKSVWARFGRHDQHCPPGCFAN